MRQLSGLDASFLFLETAEMPMHVGALHIFELPADYDGDFLADMRAHMATRIPIAPALRRKVAMMPLNLAAPAWVDAEPDLNDHIVGIHSRDNDLVVNATRTKQLTNFRVSGKEDAIKVTPPIDASLEYAVEFIADDELVEITPKSIRIRKRYLKEHDRKRASREAA